MKQLRKFYEEQPLSWKNLLIDEQVDFVEVRQATNSLILEMEPGKKINLEIAPYERFLEQFDMNVQDDLTYLKLKSEEAQLIRENSVSQALEVLRNRIDSLGISEPSLQKQGEDNIVIQLPGLKRQGPCNRIDWATGNFAVSNCQQ